MLSKDTNEHKNNHTLSETINILYNEIEHLKKRVELLENEPKQKGVIQNEIRS